MHPLSSAPSLADSESSSLAPTTNVVAGKSEPETVFAVTSVTEEIIRLSRSLFPGPVSHENAVDPEDTSHHYMVFDVSSAGEYADYRDRIIEWHDRVDEIAPNNGGQFRLIVHPRT
jgi:hypothetical protein